MVQALFSKLSFLSMLHYIFVVMGLFLTSSAFHSHPTNINKNFIPEHKVLSLKSTLTTESKKLRPPSFNLEDERTGITIGRYMVETIAANGEKVHLKELEELIMSIQTACKAIASAIDRAPLNGHLGLQGGGGSINVQGEEQKCLDVIANTIMTNALRFSGTVGVIASEEETLPLQIDQYLLDKYRDIGLQTTQFKSDVLVQTTVQGRYVAVFDPLDGSSNVDAGIPTGTIFGIFEDDPYLDEDLTEVLSQLSTGGEVITQKSTESHMLSETLRPGNSLVAAGYCLYSSSVFFCLTLGNGVNIFTYDRLLGEFILTSHNLKIPKRGKIYSFNEAHRKTWDKPLLEYVSALQEGRGVSEQPYSGRYIGSMVGDVHRTLLYGGIFGYPATKKNPDGKLRLLYEAAPMSFLMEEAGGMSTTGRNRIMDIVPQTVHQRVPCLMGSPDDVTEAISYYLKYDQLTK